MLDSNSTLNLSISGSGYFLIGLVLLGTAWLCRTGYKRNPRKLTAFLESLRFLIVLLVLFLLCRPEWVTSFVSEKEPEIAILWDDSASMTTSDVEEGKTSLIGRDEMVRKILATRFWNSLEDKNKVLVNSFSAPEKNERGEMSPMSGTDMAEALDSTLASSENLRALVLISDGDNTKGASPVASAQRYRNKGVPIFTVPIGSEISLPDIAVENIRPPAYGIVGESIQIPFTIRNTLGREINTNVTVKSPKGASYSKPIKLPPYGNLADTILWRIQEEGNETLELSVPIQAGERSDKNNKATFSLSGRRESINVLIIESEPRWEYRFIRNALFRDPGVEVNTILFHPTLQQRGEGAGYLPAFPDKLEDLSKYDVIFIGDIGLGANGLSEEQCELLKGLVESQASGIVFLPGQKGNQAGLINSPLGDLMPVLLQSSNKEGYVDSLPSPLMLTPEGRKSLLTLLANTEEDNEQVWKSLPGFYWYASVERAKAGTLVLATHPTKRNRYGRIPLLVTKMAGAGKVLYMGTDSAWRWRRGVEDLYHYRFWGQVARWMSYQRNMAAGNRVRIYPDQERPKLGDSVLLTATVADEHGAPLKAESVQVLVTSPDGASKGSIELLSDSLTWGVFTGYLKIDQPGEWTVKIAAPSDPDNIVELSLYTAGDSLEKIGRVARPDVLAELSSISKGRVVLIEDLPGLSREIESLPAPKAAETRYLIWCHWISGLVLLLLSCLFWVGRKLNGTV